MFLYYMTLTYKLEIQALLSTQELHAERLYIHYTVASHLRFLESEFAS